MNTYQFAFVDLNTSKYPFIKKICAKSLSDFHDRFVQWAFDKWYFVESEDYFELIDELESNKIYLSQVEELDD